MCACRRRPYEAFLNSASGRLVASYQYVTKEGHIGVSMKSQTQLRRNASNDASVRRDSRARAARGDDARGGARDASDEKTDERRRRRQERRDDDEGLTDGRDDAGNDAAMAKITRVGGEQARGTGTRHGADETPKRDATGRLTRRAARRRTGDERGDVRGGRAAGIRMGSERCVELTVRALIQRRTDGARVDPRQRRCRASSRAWTTPWRSPREARRTRGGAIDADSSARETL